MSASTVSSVGFAPKHLSGIDVIDNAWGGLYRGGSYLVYGRAASGRGLLTLMFAKTGASLGEPTLFISPDRQKDLMIQAASIGFDLRDAYENGVVRLMRVPPLMNLQERGDDGVAKSLWDLIAIIRQHRPTRLVMNDFMPFVAFRSFDRFRNEFIQFLEQIDSLDTTMLLVMPEPANQQSRRVIDFMAGQMTGSMHIELADDSPSTTKRRITLIPHIGHIKRQVVDYWDLEDLVMSGSESQEAPSTGEESWSMPSATDSGMTPGYEAQPTRSAPMYEQPTPGHAPPVSTPPASIPPLPSRPQQQPIQPPSTPTPSATPPPPAAPSPSSDPPPPATPPPAVPPPAAPSTEIDGPEEDLDPAHSAVERDYTDRKAFLTRLQDQFAGRESTREPFLLLALRMDRSEGRESRPFDFDFLMDLVREELRVHDDMLAEPTDERLVVLLTDSRPEDAQNFFARLKDRLKSESPRQSDHLLHAVSAIVVPDGRPFQTAGEFLAYALDED